MFKEGIRESLRDVLALMQGNFLVVTLCHSWAMSWMQIFHPYESVYLRSLGASSLIIGTYFAVNSLIGAVVGMPGGYLCDTYGRRKIVVVGNYLTAIVWVFVSLASNWQSYFMIRILLSAASFWSIAEQTIMVDSMIVEKRGLGFSLFWTIPQLAGLASPFLGAWLIENHQVNALRFVLLFIGIANGVKAVVYTKYLKETLVSRGKKQGLSFRSLIDPFTETFKSLRQMSKSLLGYCALDVLYGFALTMVAPFFILYAFDVISLTPEEWGFTSTIVLGVSICLRLLGGRLADRYGKRRLILVAIVIEAPALIAFIYSKSYFHVLLLFVMWRGIGALTEPAWNALQADLTPREQRGKITSFRSVVWTSFGFLGSITGGYIYSLNPSLIFWIYIPFTILATIIAYRFIHEPEEPEK